MPAMLSVARRFRSTPPRRCGSRRRTTYAPVTRGAVEDLRLAPRRSVVALIKSSFVILAPPEAAISPQGRNVLPGQAPGRIDGARNSEIKLDIGDGKILTAVVP
ncbi:MAG: TOBE domain-containing protein, partial [Methylocella sp.]